MAQSYVEGFLKAQKLGSAVAVVDGKIVENLHFEMAKNMKKFSDKENIEFFCSAFYPEAVKYLSKLGVKKFKVASRTCKFIDPYSLEVLKEKKMF